MTIRRERVTENKTDMGRVLAFYFSIWIFSGLLVALTFFNIDILAWDGLAPLLGISTYLMGIIICFEIARAKNSEYPLWILLGFFLAVFTGPIGVLIMASVSPQIVSSYRSKQGNKNPPFFLRWEVITAGAIIIWCSIFFKLLLM